MTYDGPPWLNINYLQSQTPRGVPPEIIWTPKMDALIIQYKAGRINRVRLKNKLGIGEWALRKRAKELSCSQQ